MLQGYFPEIANAIDPGFEPEFLDQELRELHLDPTAQDNRVDLLVRAAMRDGQSEILYLHLEVQSFAEPDFAERIFNCFAALRRACGREVLSLVILADLDADWRPSRYKLERLGCSLEFVFPCCKLLDRLPDWEDDISLPALTARAQIAALRSSRDPRRRLDLRWQLTRALLTHGYSRETITESLRMISWMMKLPRPEFLILRNQLLTFSEENNMQPLIDFEEYALELGRQEGLEKGRVEGREEGREEGLRTAILDLLALRFDRVPASFADELQQIGHVDQLRQLLAAAAQVASLDGFASELRR